MTSSDGPDLGNVADQAFADATTTRKGSRGTLGFGYGYYSMKKLIAAEANLLAVVAERLISRFIPIRFKNSEIYTISVAAEKQIDEIPVVLVHGFAAGSAVWCANIESIAKTHQVHAFDILGFGRSSRAQFSDDETLAELEMVEAMEDWRKGMKIEKMYLVAHSFGGYLASSYTLEHPSRVKHLILADPWGFPEIPQVTGKQIQPGVWMQIVGRLFTMFNPLAALRVAGPYGPTLVKKLRPDLAIRYKGVTSDDIYNYIYHCNAQPPTGETAFKSMTEAFGWAKRPMIRRFNGISGNVPVTFIYGSKSWIDSAPAIEIQSERNSFVDVQIIRGAGHQVYADCPEAFNDLITAIINRPDNETETVSEQQSHPDHCNAVAGVHMHAY